jgi:D-glycero-D-manno-heptose 1,7-bisphosphate phosphatase
VTPAIFLDRDGTLNVDVGFAHRVDDLQLIEGVVPGLRRLHELGFALVITTNQSGIARGYFSEAEMHAFNQALVELLAAEGIAIAGVYYCPFHPTEGQGRYRQESPLRKPYPGMIQLAAKELQLDVARSFAIGDKPSDVAAGRAAGCRTVQLASGVAQYGAADAAADFLARDLVDAAGYIERTSAGDPGASAAQARNRP